MVRVISDITSRILTHHDFSIQVFELSCSMSKCLKLNSMLRLPVSWPSSRHSLALLAPSSCAHRGVARTFASFATNTPRPMLASPLNRLSVIQRHFTMNTQELKNFLADSPPSTVNLVIKKHFEALSDQEARYAHFISR